MPEPDAGRERDAFERILDNLQEQVAAALDDLAELKKRIDDEAEIKAAKIRSLEARLDALQRSVVLQAVRALPKP